MVNVFRVVTDQGTEWFNDAYKNITGSAGYLVCNNIYNRVVLHEWDCPVVYPDLATHWEILDQAKAFRFYLDKAAHWQDGEPLTAHDVAYTHMEQIRKGYDAAAMLSGVAEINEVDDHTVEYVLKERDAGFLTKLGNFITTHILPAHLYEGTDWATNPYNLKPVGSGPFKVAEWTPGGNVVLEADKNFWGPQPKIERIEIIVIDDLEEGVKMVGRGDADYMEQDVLTYDRLPMLAANNPARALVTKQRGAGMARLEFNHRNPLWRDERARRAVAMAFDRSDFDATLADPGVSESWNHYLIPNVKWAFNENAVAPVMDVDTANHLLDEAGLARDGEGVRLRTPLYYMKTFDWHGDIARSLAKQLTDIGFQCEPQGLTSSDWKRVIDENHEFEFVISGGGMAPDPGVLANRYVSTSRGNWTGLTSEENSVIDDLFAKAKLTIDQNERAEIFKRIQSEWAHSVTWVPLYWYGHYFARSRHFFGWSDQIQYSVPFWHWGHIRPVADDYYDQRGE